MRRNGNETCAALELSGKLRLNRGISLAVRAIYYPGFTFGGPVGELGGSGLLAAVQVLQLGGTARFWWTAAVLVLLVTVHGAYWMFTHPVDNFGVRDVTTNKAARTFFGEHADAREVTGRPCVYYAPYRRRCLLAFAAALTH